MAAVLINFAVLQIPHHLSVHGVVIAIAVFVSPDVPMER
jgi:hypothetical protein